MAVVELRNLDDARTYLVQGLWLQRATRPSGPRIKPALGWAVEILADGQPLPPIGFLADLGQVLFGNELGETTRDPIPGWPGDLARIYEDHVLGKVYIEGTLERAADGLRRYAVADRAKGLAFVVKQMRERIGFDGVELSPAVVRGLMNRPPEEVLTEGYESLSQQGPLLLLLTQYRELIAAVRKAAALLGPEDVIAIEQRTALADMGRFVAHRQILQLTAQLEGRLPARPVRPLIGRREVPTRVHDEDQYPVGGYSSISNRGSIESLLHSQLAFMETEDTPDLFDVKFVRDELFYYSRDENKFLRRRRAFIIAFGPHLVAARFKDAELPCQRIVLVCALVLALVRKIADWLSIDALRFELLFVKEGEKTPLADEAELFGILLSELREQSVASVAHRADWASVERDCSLLARSAQVQVLAIDIQVPDMDVEGAVVTRLGVAGPMPTLIDPRGEELKFDAEDPLAVWAITVVRVLQLWV